MDPNVNHPNGSGEQSWFLSLDMIRYQRSRPLFAQRALMSIVSALLKLMGQLHQSMRRQADKMLLSQPQLFLSCLFNRFMVLVGFATAFRATFCQRVGNFYIKIGFDEPRLPKTVGLESNLASSSVVVDSRVTLSPCNGWRWGSIST